MPTYIYLVRFTQQGIGSIDGSGDRLTKSKELAEELGGTYRDFYAVLGQYDLVAICDFPDDETAARFALINGQLGNVRTETMRAFAEDEYREMLGTLGQGRGE